MYKNKRNIIIVLIMFLSISFITKQNIVKAETINSNDIYDVVLFWGQSNMVGGVGCRSRRSTDNLKVKM